MNCKHHDGRYCTLGLFGGQPSPGVCSVCSAYDGPPRGVGDSIHKLIQATSFGIIKPCGGCKQRRRTLNRLITYGDRNR